MRPIPFKKSKEEHKREAVGKLESSKFAEAQKLSETVMRDSYKLLKKMVGARGFEPRASCSRRRLAASTIFSQFLSFVAFTRFWGVCFRSQRLRLARLRGEFSDGFLTVVAVTAMLYELCSTLLQ